LTLRLTKHYLEWGGFGHALQPCCSPEFRPLSDKLYGKEKVRAASRSMNRRIEREMAQFTGEPAGTNFLRPVLGRWASIAAVAGGLSRGRRVQPGARPVNQDGSVQDRCRIVEAWRGPADAPCALFVEVMHTDSPAGSIILRGRASGCMQSGDPYSPSIHAATSGGALAVSRRRTTRCPTEAPAAG